MRELDPDYTSEVDTVDEQEWCQVLQEFEDANIYQTWPYAAVMGGRRNTSHLILRRHGVITAIAQARIAKLPLLKIGIAYIHWGPLWVRGTEKANIEVFRQAVRALRNEFSFKRRLVLRLSPVLFDHDSSRFSQLLAEEGYSLRDKEAPRRTILMDLARSTEDLRQGMKSHWKRELKLAERQGLEVVEGADDSLFEAFIDMYREMVLRKKFVEPNDINQFRLIQAQLPESLKMKIMMCKSGKGDCAGLISSAIGKTAVYLFGATSISGMKSRGSYLLQWKLIEKLKNEGVAVYNLNGINPIKNPGTYKFKSDLAGGNGTDVHFLGRFDSHVAFLSAFCVGCADIVRRIYRRGGAGF